MDPIQTLITALEDPARIADRQKYYDAIMNAINGIQDSGVQDGLAMLDTMAIIIAQQLGGRDDGFIDGALAFLSARIRAFVPDVREAGHTAPSFVVPDNIN